VGQYDVVMETGPGYNSKRQEAVEAMMPLLQGNEALFNAAADLVFRNMDFPGGLDGCNSWSKRLLRREALGRY